MRALTITDEHIVTVHDEELGLAWLQAQVGGSIEPIDVTWRDGEYVTLFVNEEGKLDRLPVNEAATRLAHHFGAIFADDDVRGGVVLVGPAGSEGEETELPEEFVAAALRVICNPGMPPVRSAPTFWEAAAEAVGAGVDVIVVGSPDDFKQEEEQA